MKKIIRNTLLLITMGLVSGPALLANIFNQVRKKKASSQNQKNQIYLETAKKYANGFLFAAVEEGNAPWVGFLLGTGAANANCKTDVSQTAVFPSDFSLLTQGITPLHYAAICGNEAIVQLLIELGQANVHATDDWRNTPLHYAYACGYPKIVGLLIAKGANQNARDKHGYTPVQYSVISQNKKRLFTRNQ